MPDSSSSSITRLLVDFSQGDAAAFDHLMPLVYDELRRIAHSRLRSERRGHTLNTTALVHEAYFRLVDQTQAAWQNRVHFYAIAAQAMRRILVDHARSRQAIKRGRGRADLPLEAAHDLEDSRSEALLALDEALTRLAARNERQSRVVECRYFAGLTIEETAHVLNVSPTTVKQDWSHAKAWLFRDMQRE